MSKVIDHMLDLMLPQASAGACVPPDCQVMGGPATGGQNPGKLWCCYRCNGTLHCV